MDGPRLLFFGAPASGKTTQCQMLAERFGAKHIDAGKVFREHASKGTPLGQEALQTLEKDDKVPGKLTIQMLKEEVQKATTGWLITGMPRTKDQAQEMLKEKELKPQAVVFLSIAHKTSKGLATLKGRIAGRLVDKSGGEVYHEQHKPPPAGADVEKKGSDNAEILSQRVKTYEANFEDIRGFYSGTKGEKLWVEVDGEGSVDDVHLNVLKELLTKKPDSIKDFLLKAKLPDGDKAKAEEKPAEAGKEEAKDAEKPKEEEKPGEKPKDEEKPGEKPKEEEKPKEKPKEEEKPTEKPKEEAKPAEKPKEEKPAEAAKT